jgi:hypothetical protein
VPGEHFVDFAWDPQKARSNFRKHGISFAEAITVFGDLGAVTVDDLLHSSFEDRMAIIGLSGRRRLVVVTHVSRGATIRIISARPATRREYRLYEEAR